MKRLSLLIVFVLLAAMAKAQKGVLLKFKYLPKRTYEINSKNGFDMQMAVEDGSGNLDGNIGAAQGDITMKVATELNVSVKTGADVMNTAVTVLGHNYSTKVSLNGAETPAAGADMLSGLTLNGKLDADGKLIIDTAGAADVLKSAASLVTSEMPKYLKFPDKHMKVGDVFTQEANLNALDMPDFGIVKDYPMKVTYKLIAVKNNLAYFDTTSEFNLRISTGARGTTANINGTGSGAGKMVFHVLEGYPKSSMNNVDCVLDVGLSDTKFAIKFNMNTDVLYVVK